MCAAWNVNASYCCEGKKGDGKKGDVAIIGRPSVEEEKSGTRPSAGELTLALPTQKPDIRRQTFSILLLHSRGVQIRPLFLFGNTQPLLSNGEISTDPASKKTLFNDAEIKLTGKEYRLLHSLLRNPGRIYSREEQEEKVHGRDDEVSYNAVEVLIRSLRKKKAKPAIVNLRGLSWMVPK